MIDIVVLLYTYVRIPSYNLYLQDVTLKLK